MRALLSRPHHLSKTPLLKSSSRRWGFQHMHFGTDINIQSYSLWAKTGKNSQERKEPSLETHREESAVGPWKLQIFMGFNQRFEWVLVKPSFWNKRANITNLGKIPKLWDLKLFFYLSYSCYSELATPPSRLVFLVLLSQVKAPWRLLAGNLNPSRNQLISLAATKWTKQDWARFI